MLDGVVLVVSAVEGVQSQTRVLMRALRRLQIPTLLFVNKVDRRGADCERVVREIRARLRVAALPMGSVTGEGARDAAFEPGADGLLELLAEHDESLLGAYVDEASVSPQLLREALADQTKRSLVHPVFCGSAITGAGIEALTAGIAELLPADAGDADGPVSATVFKVDRGPTAEREAYARLFSGTISVRDRVRVGEAEEGKVTAIGLFDGATAVRSPSVRAGQIAKLWGLATVQIGDTIGRPRPGPVAARLRAADARVRGRAA